MDYYVKLSRKGQAAAYLMYMRETTINLDKAYLMSAEYDEFKIRAHYHIQLDIDMEQVFVGPDIYDINHLADL